MKRILTIAFACAALALHAEDYNYLTLAYADVEQSIDLGTVQKITFEGDDLVVYTSAGNTTVAQSTMQKIYFSATATGIDAVEQGQSAPQGCYDLSGRQIVKPLQRGIYIVNGKKLLVK